MNSSEEEKLLLGLQHIPILKKLFVCGNNSHEKLIKVHLLSEDLSAGPLSSTVSGTVLEQPSPFSPSRFQQQPLFPYSRPFSKPGRG